MPVCLATAVFILALAGLVTMLSLRPFHLIKFNLGTTEEHLKHLNVVSVISRPFWLS